MDATALKHRYLIRIGLLETLRHWYRSNEQALEVILYKKLYNPIHHAISTLLVNQINGFNPKPIYVSRNTATACNQVSV